MKKLLVVTSVIILVLFCQLSVFAESTVAESSNSEKIVQADEKENVKWLLPVAVFFFISVTSGVVAVAIYNKKINKKPVEKSSADKNE